MLHQQKSSGKQLAQQTANPKASNEIDQLKSDLAKQEKVLKEVNTQNSEKEKQLKTL